MRPLRLALVSATFPPYQAGTGNVCLDNARALAARGHEVHVFTAAYGPAPAAETRDGITVHRLRPPLRLGNAPLLPGLAGRLHGFDVLHLHAPFVVGAEQTALAARRRAVPLVLTWHNDLIATGWRGALLAAYQRLTVRLTVRGAALLCVVSLDHFSHSLLGRQLGEAAPPVVEMPNPVDTTHFRPAGPTDWRRRLDLPAGAGLLLFVAALDRAHEFKNLDGLLQALSTLPTTTHLAVVGDGEMRSGHERRAAALGLGGRVHFLGRLPREALPACYRAADWTVLPSTRQESFGLALVESLACGTPVVASSLPGVRDVVDPGVDGFLVAPGDATALRETLSRALALPAARRREMGLAGRRKVRARYDLADVGERLEACYAPLLPQGAPAVASP